MCAVSIGKQYESCQRVMPNATKLSTWQNLPIFLHAAPWGHITPPSFLPERDRHVHLLAIFIIGQYGMPTARMRAWRER